MADGDTTRWTMIRRAAEGEAPDREEFARRYESVIRAYFGARWRRSPLIDELEDAAQETFLACFKKDGALGRVDPGRPGGFRAYLYGVTRNVALRAEEKRARGAMQPDSRIDLGEIESRDEPLSAVFDRAWAKALLREAIRLQTHRARETGQEAVRRVEILRLRFRDDLPVRQIACAWDEDPTYVHRQYAKARKEFAAALHEVVGEHLQGTRAEIDAECARLAEHFR